MIGILQFLAPFAFALVGSLASRVLTAIGIGYVTYVGLDVLVGNLAAAATGALGSAGAAGYVISASGFGESVMIITAAWATKAALTGLKRLAPYTS